jgi:hypothetical protein
MDAYRLKGVVYLLTTALVGFIAISPVAWQAATFNPEIQMVTLNLRHPVVLGVQSSKALEALALASATADPVIIEGCKTEAETAWQAYLAEKNLSSMTQEYCGLLAPDFPCQTRQVLEAKYGDPASPEFVADAQTRSQIIEAALQSNTETRAREVLNIAEVYYVEADQVYATTYSTCLTR